MSGKPSSTIAFEKRWNPLLSLPREAFIDALGDVPPKPAAMEQLLRRTGGARGERHDEPVRLGLRENLAQFSLLVVVNAFVGAMVGMERTSCRRSRSRSSTSRRRPRCSRSSSSSA
jgi:hypothetical protein